jgi:hypothetical protein
LSEWQKAAPKAITGRRMIGGNAFRDQRIIGGSGIGCSLLNQPPRVPPCIFNLIVDVGCVHEVRIHAYCRTTKEAAGRISAGRSQPGGQGGEFRAQLTIDPISPPRLLRICGTSLVLLLSRGPMIARPGRLVSAKPERSLEHGLSRGCRPRMTQLIFAITDAIAERSLAGLKQSQQPIYSGFAWVLVQGPATNKRTTSPCDPHERILHS